MGDNHPIYTHRKATSNDISTIVMLLKQDILGQQIESTASEEKSCYIDAFNQIDNDPHQYLMVVENNQRIIGTCHLSLIPSMTLRGSTRLNIESVRIHPDYRNHGVGEWMMQQAIAYGQSKGAKIIQLTCDNQRANAIHFYKNCGFKATHQGMKIYLDEQ